jgi:hypothetical protein
MTDGMKWFVVISMALFFLMMGIFVMVSSQSPGISTPEQQRVDAYNDCIKHWQGWGGPSDSYVATCKEISGHTGP